MKKLILLIMATFPLFIYAQNTTCVIKGKIEGIEKPAKLSFSTPDGKRDTIVFDKGQFEFKEDIEYPTTAALDIMFPVPKSMIMHLSVPIFLQMDTIKLDMINPGPNLIVKVSGPILSVDYQDKLMRPLFLVIDRRNKKAKEYHEALKNKTPDTTLLKRELTAIYAEDWDIPRTYIKANKNSILSITALEMMGDGDPTSADKVNDLKNLYNSLSEEVRLQPEAIKYANRLKKLITN